MPNGKHHIVACAAHRWNKIVTSPFAAGTHILTARGEVAVEALQASDTVETVTGDLRAIVFLGRRRIDCTRHPRPRDICPVRVRAHAFADGAPWRDLLLSPEHGVYIDDLMIPIRRLVNGVTIVQEAVDEIVYWSVELAEPEVIFAEHLPCETWPDAAGRSAFDNGGAVVQLHPYFPSRFRLADRFTGAELTTIRRYLLDRAGRPGQAIEAELVRG